MGTSCPNLNTSHSFAMRLHGECQSQGEWLYWLEKQSIAMMMIWILETFEELMNVLKAEGQNLAQKYYPI